MLREVLRAHFLLGILLAFFGLWPSVSPAQQLGEPLRPPWCLELPRPAYKTLERVNVPGSWFEVYRIRPDVFAIYEPHQFEEVISYLILGAERGLLFDTGLGIGNISSVVKRLTSLPVTVLNSHSHFDHIGGNSEFGNILGMKTNFTLDHALGFPNARVKDALQAIRVCGRLPEDVDPESYSIHAFQISEFVKEGYRINLGGRELEVILTPGHTPDSLCLLDRGNRLLFTGDTFYLGPIYLYTPETDFALYSKSVDKLAKLAPTVDLLLPGHNVPTANPGYLAKLAEAVRQVQAGTVQPKMNEGRREYVFEGFSLLLAGGR